MSAHRVAAPTLLQDVRQKSRSPYRLATASELPPQHGEGERRAGGKTLVSILEFYAEKESLMSFETAQHHRVEELAYEFWERRGSPLGSPDEDWFRAQAELNGAQQEQELPVYALRFEPDER